jgi:hypothetical protein
MNRDFRAFRAVDFNWTHDLQSVWSDPATQLPKGIANAIVSNCTTHVYGRMSSPATIQATSSWPPKAAGRE